jgi:hypothetical protein
MSSLNLAPQRACNTFRVRASTQEFGRVGSGWCVSREERQSCVVGMASGHVLCHHVGAERLLSSGHSMKH